MANSFYNHGTYPATGASGSSSAMRAELDLIAAGFELLPALSGNAGKFVLVNSGASALTVASTLSETGSALTASGTLTVGGLLTANAGLAVTGTVSGTGFSTYLASPPAIGGTAAAAGAFTTLSASSTVSGTGFSTYLASPPAIGGTAAAAGAFTTLGASGAVTLSGGTINQVQYLNGSKVLSGSANLTFDGTTLTAAGLTGPHNGTVGATTPSTGSFTTLAVSSTLTLSAGTANMVPYLNASKQLIGSGNFSFTGFWLQIGGASVGSQTAGITAYSSVAVAYRLVNGVSGNTATDGADIELNSLDLNIINREAGNLTLWTSGTEAMRLDASGNLGIGTSSIAALGAGYTTQAISGTNGSGIRLYAGATEYARWYADSAGTYLQAVGAATPIVFLANGAERMRLDASGNLGIGTSAPGFRLSVVGTAGTGTIANFSPATGTDGALIRFNNVGTGDFFVGKDSSAGNSFGSGAAYSANLYNGANTPMLFWTNATEKMRLDASGNLGLGVTPSAWLASNNTKVMQLGGGSFVSYLNNQVWLTNNYFLNSSGQDTYVNTGAAMRLIMDGAYKFQIAPSGTAGNAITFTQAMTLDASGNLLVGVTSGTYHRLSKSVAEGTIVGAFTNATGGCFFYGANTGGANAAANAVSIDKNTTTSRSINAAGTINASGADYAEYENNNGLKFTKGDVVGFKADGTLTNVYADAIRFGIKSTNPSYVGGDTWGTEDAIGEKPVQPAEDDDQSQYLADLAAWEAALEAARQLVDRIAYSGKVPCNVTGATPGGYIIAVDNAGAIAGEFVADPDFAQYKKAVGRVNRILPDDRCEVAVIIH